MNCFKKLKLIYLISLFVQISCNVSERDKYGNLIIYSYPQEIKLGIRDHFLFAINVKNINTQITNDINVEISLPKGMSKSWDFPGTINDLNDETKFLWSIKKININQEETLFFEITINTEFKKNGIQRIKIQLGPKQFCIPIVFK